MRDIVIKKIMIISLITETQQDTVCGLLRKSLSVIIGICDDLVCVIKFYLNSNTLFVL